jgi:hypothetical protein
MSPSVAERFPPQLIPAPLQVTAQSIAGMSVSLLTDLLFLLCATVCLSDIDKSSRRK